MKNLTTIVRRMIGVVAMAAVATMASAGPVGSVYNPNDYTALNSGAALNYSSGTLTFNTDNGSVSHSGDGSLGTGSVDQPNASGEVKMTVFAFSSINLAGGVVITVTGQRGIVLASQGDLTFGGSLSVSGANGTTSSTLGQGGPGAEGGNTGLYTGSTGDNGTLDSDPPSATAGNGGYQPNSSPYDGNPKAKGFGGGETHNSGSFSPGSVGGGGGYGGDGETGYHPSGSTTYTRGGWSYGDDLLEDLYGGSGGGGGNQGAVNVRPGGAGARGSFYVLQAPPPAGTVFIVR